MFEFVVLHVPLFYTRLIVECAYRHLGHTKRGVATAAIISFGNIGGAIGGQIYRAEDAKNGFVRGHMICAVMMAISAFLTLTMKYFLIRENKRRDNLTPEEFEREAQGEELCDNHPGFRYYS